jgi:hypothetical protein
MAKQMIVVFYRLEFDMAIKRNKGNVTGLTTVSVITEGSHWDRSHGNFGKCTHSEVIKTVMWKAGVTLQVVPGFIVYPYNQSLRVI